MAGAADLPVANGDFPCIDDTTASRYIKDFSIDIASFGGKELCDSKSDSKMLLDAITVIEQGQFDTSSGTNVFLRGLVGNNGYYNWMKTETRGMRRGNDVPTATAYNSGGYFTLQDGWVSLASLGRVGVIIHEARHTEGYYHIACDHGPYETSSMAGCDTTLQYGGSHAVEMEYYSRVVVQGKNFHPAYKSMARLMALARANFVFNQSPLKVREGLVALDSNTQQPVLVDNGVVSERVTPLFPGARLKRSSFGATLFSPGTVLSLDLYGSAQKDYAIQDDYSYFKFVNRSDHIIANAADLLEHDQGTQRFLVALNADKTVMSFIFGDGAWSQTSQPVQNAQRLVSVAPDGTDGVFVVAQNGTIYPYDPSSFQLGAPLSISWPDDTVAMARLKGEPMELTKEGVIYSKQSGGRTPYAPLTGRTFSQMVSVPLYDAYDVTP